MIFYDTETCGLHGMPVLLQYAVNDGDIYLHNFWYNTIGDNLRLIKMFMEHETGVVGFNLAFDHFQLCKAYTVFSLIDDWDAYPVDLIDELGELEPYARDGLCLKPVKACDLFLEARKGPYQSCMDRHDIRIKRVPTAIAFQLADELEARIPLKDIYFARGGDTNKRWQVYDVTDGDGHVNPDFKDVVLKFKPSTALKVLAIDALGEKEDDILRFSDIEVDRKFLPKEVGHAPYAKAIPFASKKNWQGTWPQMIKLHIDHWEYNELARTYARKDVDYTRRLYDYFGRPEVGDVDSNLACAVAAIRWRGFRVDTTKIEKQRQIAEQKEKSAPTDHHYVKRWIFPLLTPEQVAVTENSTDKVTMEEMATWGDECDCTLVSGEPDKECKTCGGTGTIDNEITKRAKAVTAARTAGKERELFDKLLQAERFHASFKIIGALSGRMAGADGLNPQGIKATKEVRECFYLNWPGMSLCGGDFDSFEVGIAVSIYDDPKLTEELKSGKKIHALFAQAMFPEETYDSILLSQHTENDKYKKGKSGLFSSLYGGTAHSLVNNIGLSQEMADNTMENWAKTYEGVARAQIRVTNMFQSMRQVGGIGSRIIWKEPAEFMPTLLGFKRYYTLENMICKALFDLGNDPPKSWLTFKAKVNRRRDGSQQTEQGAARSALFGAAFALQQSNVRSATNHEIQGTGAGITKIVQEKIWQIQPSGINEWIVMPMNIHDEILCPVKWGYELQVKKIVSDTVESFRPLIPLIGMEWKMGMKSWASK